MNINGTWCCGVKEIAGISGYNRRAPQALDRLYRSWRDQRIPNVPFIVFTEASPVVNAPTLKLYGRQIANLIKRSHLGSVSVAGPSKNPNSMNYVRVYTWKVNWAAYHKWAAKRGVR